MKKSLYIILLILLVAILVMLVKNSIEPTKASDTVDMAYFNETIASLNTKIDNIQLEQKAINEDLQNKIETLNSQVAALKKQNTNLANELNNTTDIAVRTEKLSNTIKTGLTTYYNVFAINGYIKRNT